LGGSTKRLIHKMEIAYREARERTKVWVYGVCLWKWINGKTTCLIFVGGYREVLKFYGQFFKIIEALISNSYYNIIN